MGSKADALTRDLGNSLADSIGPRNPTRAVTRSPTRSKASRGTSSMAADQSHLHRGRPGQGRDRPRSDALLIESVCSVGLLQPVRVRWAGDHGKYCVVTGHRRLAAAVACGLDKTGCRRRGYANRGRDYRGAANRESSKVGAEPARSKSRVPEVYDLDRLHRQGPCRSVTYI